MASRLHLESGGRLAGEAYSGGVLDGLRLWNRNGEWRPSVIGEWNDGV
jgi:hypothetical protein